MPKPLLSKAVIIFFTIVLISTGPVLAEHHVKEWKLGERTLRVGSWGSDVFELQRYLVQLGYEVTMDGRFGKGTSLAVKEFQHSSGLKADGIVGPGTAMALVRTQKYFNYAVQPGDSLWIIARKFDTTMTRLITINNLTVSNLSVGQLLKIPTLETYIVKPGDTLSVIARQFGSTAQQVAELNGIEDPTRLRIGRRLLLPRQ